MGDWSKVVTDLGPVKSWVRSAAIEIVTACPYQIYFAWGAPGRGTGDHARGLALDLMNYAYGGGVDNPGPERRHVQDWVKTYVMQHRVRLGLDGPAAYIIADRQIASDESNPEWTWRRYTGTDPHTNHVHHSFKASHVYRPPTTSEDWLMGAREDILAAISSLRLGVDQEMSAFAARLAALENIVGQIPAKVWDEKLSPDPKSPYYLAARTAQIGTMGKLDDAKRRDLAELQRDLEADQDRMRIEEAVTDPEDEEPTPPPPSA